MLTPAGLVGINVHWAEAEAAKLDTKSAIRVRRPIRFPRGAVAEELWLNSVFAFFIFLLLYFFCYITYSNSGGDSLATAAATPDRAVAIHLPPETNAIPGLPRRRRAPPACQSGPQPP